MLRSMGTPPRRIVLVAYPGVQTLDVIGPAEVFAAASRLATAGGGASPGAYRRHFVAPEPERHSA